MNRLDKDWIGSVSSGTLREVDLIPAFEEVLDAAGVEYDRPASADKLLLGQSLTDDESEEVGFYLNEELFDLLGEIAPEGDQVTVKETVEGYYSRYGGRPAIFLQPGMVGVVGAIDVPSVNQANVSFVCVDFFCHATGRTERAAVLYPNLRKK